MKNWIIASSAAWALALMAQHESSAQNELSEQTAAPPPPASPAQPDAGTSSSPPVSIVTGPAVVPRSTVHRFQSAIVDDVYEVRVSIPEDYDNDAELRPVIYALDGQWNFTLISDIVGKLAYDGLIPDPIVVGITWADAGFQPAPERLRDFTPEPLPGAPVSGGAAQFLQVLEQEVFPLVESSYRASTERVITGGSLGGLFVSYALVERPDLFKGYVASSGATDYAPDYFTRRLGEINPEQLRNERAYFSVGANYDNTEVVTSFVSDLQAVVGETPEVVLDVVPGVGHTGNEPFAYTRGLLHAFQRPRLPLSQELLQRYEGDYVEPTLPDPPALTIEAGDGELYILQDDEPWAEVFYAASPTHFYADGVDVDLTFHHDADGKLGFTLNIQRDLYELVRR